MGFFAIGVNHTTAPVELREQIAFDTERLQIALAAACQQGNVSNVVILSTCNRTEIYALGEQPQPLINWLADFNHIGVNHLLQHVYQFANEAAVRHLIRVASGLDSMVLGEPQILGQVKQAFQLAQQAGTVGNELKRLFEHGFYAAKKVRSETAVGEQAVSMGFAVVQLARQVFSHLADTTALLVAAGEMNSLVARHLVEHGVGRILICNRSLERAHRLAEELVLQVPVDIIPLEQLADTLPRADIVSSCSGSLYPVIAVNDVRQALKKRRYQPMLMVDLAVPRDIEPQVARLDDVYLYDIDHLQSVIEGNLAQRQQAARAAEAIVSELAGQFMRQQRAEQAGPYIMAYRQQVEQVKLQELEKARHALAQGQPAEQVMQRMLNALSAKLMHAPSQMMRQAAMHEQPDILDWTVAQLIDAATLEKIKTP